MMKNIQRFFTIVALLFNGVVAYAQSASQIRAYIARYQHIAIDHEQRYKIPAAITMAQGILESGAGLSGLTRNANNHFGIKCGRGWKGGVYKAKDDEPGLSSFRCYSSAEASYEDHARLLLNNKVYASLFQYSVYDYRNWAYGLKRCGYATAPNYAESLIGFIDAYQLYNLTGGKKLRGGSNKRVVVKKVVKQVPIFEDEKNIVMNDNEQSSEQIMVEEAVKKYKVAVNDVRCTILYPGETLADISKKYGVPTKDLLKFNETNQASDFQAGDVVYLEKKKNKYTGAVDFYRVKEGDTLYSISQQFGVKMEKLAKLNHIDLYSRVKEGDKISLK